jgi:hypothetical protein
MPNPRIPRQPDLVLITWTRNPLVPGSARTISAVRVIGSAKPCRSLLVPGAQLLPALRCLKRNGFAVVLQRKTTDVSGFVLLQR